MSEAAIIINGLALSNAQSMSLRVAVSHLRIELNGEPEFRAMIGEDLAADYDQRLAEVESIMAGLPRRVGPGPDRARVHGATT